MTRPCLTCCSLANTRCSDFQCTIRIRRLDRSPFPGKSAGPSGLRRHRHSKGFCIHNSVRYRQPLDETKFLLARCVSDDGLHCVCNAAFLIKSRGKLRRDHPQWDTLRRHRRRAATGRPRNSRRSHRRHRRFQISESEHGHRCKGPRSRAGFHQYAFVVDGVADSGWPLPKRNPTRRNDRNHGRG